MTRTDARSIVTTYCQNGTSSLCYNGLDQPLYKTYSDSTPPVSYTYNTGWLSQEQAGANSNTINSWDGVGRVTSASQTTAGQTYLFQIQYTPYMGVQSITYPNSQRIVTTTYDSRGRPYSLSGVSGSNTTNYVTATTYQPHGAIAQQTLTGGNLVVTRCSGANSCDNSRLQATYLQIGNQIGNLLTLQYGYSSSQNNGNVLTQTITRGGQAWTQSYSYAEATGWNINRLACANEATGTTAVPCGNSGPAWTQTYGYDLPGNRWLINAGPSNVTADLIMGPNNSGSGPYDASNRVSMWDVPNCYNNANCYDGSGNLLAVPATGGAALRTANYDAENRMTSATSAGVTTSYVYDAEGRRVQKTVGSTVTIYAYDPLGNLAQEYGTSSGSGTLYVHADPLGSTRLVTDSTGAAQRCYDYLPFGEEIATGTSGRTSCFGSNSYPTATLDIVDTKFTSKERDAETGLDWFESRYYSSAQGRFTSPDEFKGGFLDAFTGQAAFQPGPLPYADIGDPQTLNKYAYVRNNPLRYTDPDGHADVDVIVKHTFEIVATIEHGAETTATVALGGALRVAGVVGAFFTFAAPAGGVDEDKQIANINKQGRERDLEKQRNKEAGEEGAEKELQPSTSGAGARKGGGKDIRQTTVDSTTDLEGATTRRQDISAEQAGKRKQGRGEDIHSIEKTKQREQHQLDRTKELPKTP